MKSAQILIVGCIFLLVAGCGADSKKTGEIKVGAVLNAEVVPTSFNERPKTRIETTGGTFMVPSIISVLKGKMAGVATYDDGRSYLCIEDRKRCPIILGN